MTRINLLLIFVIVGLLYANSVRGQESTPVLSQLAIMTLRQAATQVELTQLRAALAIQQYQEATAKAQATIKMYQIEGYELDLQKMVYVPKPTNGKKVDEAQK